MLLNPNHIWLCAVLFCALLHVGCSAKKPIVSKIASFRLASFTNDSLLLTPAIPEDHPITATIRLTLAGRMRPSVNSDCSAERGPFRIEQGINDPSSIDISMPSPERWLNDLEGRAEPDSSAEVEALDAFLADVDQLQQDGCFIDTSVSIRDFILQSIPMRP